MRTFVGCYFFSLNRHESASSCLTAEQNNTTFSLIWNCSSVTDDTRLFQAEGPKPAGGRKNMVYLGQPSSPVADPEFYNGGADGWGLWRRGGEVWGGSTARSREKNEFLPETGGFGCILGWLFTFKKAYETNWSGQWGAAAPSPWIRHWSSLKWFRADFTGLTPVLTSYL